MDFQMPVLIGLLIEGVVFYVDELAVKRNFDWRLIAALITGIVGAVAFGLDVYADAGLLAVIPFAGSVFTGILFSRMANLAHNTIERIRDKSVGE